MAGDNDDERTVSISARIPVGLVTVLLGAVGVGGFALGAKAPEAVNTRASTMCFDNAERAYRAAEDATAIAKTVAQTAEKIIGVAADQSKELESLIGRIDMLQADLHKRTLLRYTADDAASDRREHDREHAILDQTLSSRESWMRRLQDDLEWLVDGHRKERREGNKGH